ncbi:MAG TPA: AAA family ATPase [Hyphomicrobiales bacterium]|nr:AAA family ATPase [Hyphomicrobiales bacterium]
MADQQADVFAFLADPATHGMTAAVRRIDTHGAAVFLAGDDVYKVKRAVRFPFMDFSTLEKRRQACAAEIAVNRDNAPAIYRGIVPIVRAGDGLRLGGDGEVVEWAVHLKRFDEDRTLDRLAERGEFPDELVPALVEAVMAAHARAAISDGTAATAALGDNLEETLAEIAAAPTVFPPAEAEPLAGAMRTAFARLRPLLLARGAAGRVRRCHGDLHLRNIALIDGRPVLFDAIEFDESIATTDVLYDLAFLVMDLWQRGLHAAANRVLNRYLWGADDEAAEIAGLAALPLFLALRALIRAKVAVAAGGQEGEARAYFAAACRFMAATPPRLVAVGGLSGSGKTTIAAALAPEMGSPPGAVHLRSDIERKRLFRAAETERLPEAAYSQEATAQVYAALRRLAAAALAAGCSVTVDAVHQRFEEREAIARVAADAGVPFTGLWLDAPVAALAQRVEARKGDASDATAAVVEAQAARSLGDLSWPRIDAGAGIGETLRGARAAVGAA